MKNKHKQTSSSQTIIQTASITKPKSKTLLYFIIKFAVLFILFEACYFNDYLYNHVFIPINNIFAAATAKLLSLIGINATSSGDSISNNAFAMSVKQGCDSLEALAIFVCGVIAFPSNLKIKVQGLVIGSFIILFMNLIRLISLFWIGLHYRDLFDLFHLEIWQGFFIILSIVLWLIWVMKAVKPINSLKND